MRKLFPLVVLLCLAATSFAQSTNVHFQNNTDLQFTTSASTTGGLSGSNWSGFTGMIDTMQRKTQILSFDRLFGFSTSTSVYYLTSTIVTPTSDTLNLQVELSEIFGTTTFRFAMDGSFFTHPWYDDNTIYEETIAMGGENYILRYQSYLTAPSGLYDDIMIAISPEVDRVFQVPPSDTLDPNVLNVLSYNVYLRPQVLFPEDDQDVRIHHIADYVHGFDAIMFQEVFDNGPRATLLANLAAEYPYQSSVTGDPSNPLEDGGTLIVSRFPILAEDQYLWGSNCHLDDCTANKGIKYVSINKLGTPYHLFNTHMDAFNDPPDILMRITQMELFNDFIDSLNIPTSEAVFMGGDFNVDRISNKLGEYDSLWTTMKGEEPLYTGRAVTWDTDYNFYHLTESDTSEHLDYVISHKDYLSPSTASNNAILLRSNHLEMFNVFDLSDHDPVWGRFEFPPLSTEEPMFPTWSNSLLLYPNPISSGNGFQAQLEIHSDISGTVRLNIFDPIGRVVHDQHISIQQGKETISIDGSPWSSGIYMIRATLPDGAISTVRVIKE